MARRPPHRPPDAAGSRASPPAVEDPLEDPRVGSLLKQVEDYARTGEDRPVAQPPPLPPPDEYAPDERKEHWEAVAPARAREVAHPEQKVVIKAQRTLTEIAADAGISVGEFQALCAGDRRARTMLAVRLVDHLDRAKSGTPLAAAGKSAQSQEPQGGSPRRPIAAVGGPDRLAGLPTLDADGSLIADELPPTPAVAASSEAGPGGAGDLLDHLPALDADGTVRRPNDAGPDAGAPVRRVRSFASPASPRAPRLAGRGWWLLAAALAALAALVLLLISR